ncbi:UNVERIFIED_CONTAM: hypothetical protein K2H54_066772 [Gekko kuhli]
MEETRLARGEGGAFIFPISKPCLGCRLPFASPFGELLCFERGSPEMQERQRRRGGRMCPGGLIPPRDLGSCPLALGFSHTLEIPIPAQRLPEGRNGFRCPGTTVS